MSNNGIETFGIDIGKIKFSQYKENNLTDLIQHLPYKTYGGSERKKAVLYKGSTWMLKYPDPIREKGKDISYINNAISEYIACKIIKEIGLPVQEVELGIVNIKESGKTKVVCLCKDFLLPNEVLMPIKTILLSKDDIEYPVYEIEDYKSLVFNDTRLCGLDIEDYFWKMFVCDALLCNPDRHDENWGLIYDGSSIKFSPIYDCGSSLFPVLDNYNLSIQDIQNKVLDSYAFFKENGKKINYNTYIKNLNSKYINIIINNLNLDSVIKIILDIPSLVGNLIPKQQLIFYIYCILIAYHKMFRQSQSKSKVNIAQSIIDNIQ